MSQPVTTSSKWVPLNEVWAARIETETFRIFPQGKDGTTRPVTIIRQFLFMKHEKSGLQTTFKRFLHMREWKWHIEGKLHDEVQVRKLLGGMLRCEKRAVNLMLATVVSGCPSIALAA